MKLTPAAAALLGATAGVSSIVWAVRVDERRPQQAARPGPDGPRDERVQIPATELVVSSLDWEAAGRVLAPRYSVKAFAIDRFEVPEEIPPSEPGGKALPQRGLSQERAQETCRRRGGRLPSEGEWLAAVARRDRDAHVVELVRYPWGDTGAVCRRAAWGLASGPCGWGGAGPEPSGLHPDGRTPLGLEDMAGNVAEWVVASEPGRGRAYGGHWASEFAAELRTWASFDVDPSLGDPRVGFRCAYDPEGPTSDHRPPP